jgi:hypothetical protein
MIDDIGKGAGQVWKFLYDQRNPVTLNTLKRNLPISSTLIMMGLGWLAKEGKISIGISDESYQYRISLKR